MLRDDGIIYFDYVAGLVRLLFHQIKEYKQAWAEILFDHKLSECPAMLTSGCETPGTVATRGRPQTDPPGSPKRPARSE